MKTRRPILLAQLPIPPAGLSPIVGNVPLAAGYLILHAQQCGLDRHYDFSMLPPPIANTYSESGLVEDILSRDPWMVGFSCYLWNIDRTLWIARQLKARRPELVIVLGGPEITSDNAWVLASGAVDYAVVGEGEQTFSELLNAWSGGADSGQLIPGLWRATNPCMPLFRKPLANLSQISSPYLTGLLDTADERMLLLETIRGCVFSFDVASRARTTYRSIGPELVEGLLSVCYRNPNYLDRYYSLNPQGLLGSKRVVVQVAESVDDDWADAILDTATLIEV